MRKEVVEISGLGSHGEGVGSIDGYTIFVPGALPGEKVEVEIVERHKRYAVATLVAILKESPNRVKPICPLFGTCGGCQIMHLAYEKQLDVKKQRVIDAFKRIGKIMDVEVHNCVPSPNPFEYRNKIQLPVRGDLIGLYKANSHDLVQVDHCYIHNALGEKVYQEIRKILKKFPAKLRSILIRSSTNTNEALVVFVTYGKPTYELKKIAEQLMQSCKEVKGVLHDENDSPGNVILGNKFTTLAGNETIEEKISGLSFRVSANSFFQVNPKQAEQLYQRALELGEPTSSSVVVDAYCGVGTLSLIFARKSKKVIGIECVKQAIEDAHNNATRNEIPNCEFFCGLAENVISTIEKMDILLLNPPRKGCDPSLIQEVGKKLPHTIIYISCDPATLARDLSQFKEFGYHIEVAEPFDMFPQTAHVETIVKLTNLS